jgi:hypothetical protein
MEGKANRQRRIHEMTGVLFGQSKGLRDLSHTRPAWVLLKIIPNTPPLHPGLYSPPPFDGRPLTHMRLRDDHRGLGACGHVRQVRAGSMGLCWSTAGLGIVSKTMLHYA